MFLTLKKAFYLYLCMVGVWVGLLHLGMTFSCRHGRFTFSVHCFPLKKNAFFIVSVQESRGLYVNLLNDKV